MTARDDLVAQVEQALRDAATPEESTVDFAGFATAAVDAVAIWVYVALASGDGQFLQQIEKMIAAKKP